jgi:3-methyladenine DNA glycosylase/8-oxoguanine DNA glycosylase
VERYSEAELFEVHGIGPKIAEAFALRGTLAQ